MKFVPRMAEGRVCCSNEHFLCDACRAYHEDPPDPYRAGIEAFRAANATRESLAEEQYKAERLRALAAEYAEGEGR